MDTNRRGAVGGRAELLTTATGMASDDEALSIEQVSSCMYMYSERSAFKANDCSLELPPMQVQEKLLAAKTRVAELEALVLAKSAPIDQVFLPTAHVHRERRLTRAL